MTSQYVPVIIELVPLTKSWMSVYFVTEATANRSTRVPACDDVTTQALCTLLFGHNKVNKLHVFHQNALWPMLKFLWLTLSLPVDHFEALKVACLRAYFSPMATFLMKIAIFSNITKEFRYSYAHGTPLRQYFGPIDLPWSYIEEEQQIRPTSPSEITHWLKAISVA